MIVRYSLLPALLLVLCSAVEARSEQTVSGLPFADEYVWRADYYVHEDAWRPSYAETLRTLVVATESATDILQTTVSPEDWSCPVRFQQRRMLRFAPSQPDYEEIGDFSFRLSPGVYLYPSPGGSQAAYFGDIAKLGVGPGFTRRAGWILAHELGHNAGLLHQANSVMTGGGEGDGGGIVLEDHCNAFIGGGEVLGKSLCLLFDADREAQGLSPYVPAPAWTPCSDGSGVCNHKGRCIPTRPQCFDADGGTAGGTDCSTSNSCGVCSGWRGLCLPCDSGRGLDQPNRCGNGIVEGDEQCDDGNLYAGDGCTARCKLAPLLPAFTTDSDGDGLFDYEDRCPHFPFAPQDDLDGDGYGNLCDSCPTQVNFDQSAPCRDRGDEDGDGLPDFIDNCPGVASSELSDRDFDFVGDACDNCPDRANKAQLDIDQDGVGNGCVCGDMNGDGTLTFADASCVSYCVLGIDFPNCRCTGPLADTQDDGLLRYDDASNVAAVVMGRLAITDLYCAARPAP